MWLYVRIRIFSFGTLVCFTLFFLVVPHFIIDVSVIGSIFFCCLVVTLLFRVIAMVEGGCCSWRGGGFLVMIFILVFSTVPGFRVRCRSFY